MKEFDAIIIGAGQAGPSLAGRLTSAGMTAALRSLLFGISPTDPITFVAIPFLHALVT